MSETENFHVLPRQRSGRPNHECWDGFAKVYLSNGRSVARCLTCDDLVQNTGKERLKKHRDRCSLNLLKAKRLMKSDPCDEIIWIESDAAPEWEGYRQSAEPNFNGTYYAQCKNCLATVDAMLEDMRAHKEICVMELKDGDTLYFGESCEEEVIDQEDVITEETTTTAAEGEKPSPKETTKSPTVVTIPQAKRQKKMSYSRPSTAKTFTMKNVDKSSTAEPSGTCASCKKPLSRFSDMAKVWERKLDELPLEQALSIEKKMSDMLYEAMITNMQTQKAMGGKWMQTQ